MKLDALLGLADCLLLSGSSSFDEGIKYVGDEIPRYYYDGTLVKFGSFRFSSSGGIELIQLLTG